MALIKQCISCGVRRSALAPFGRDSKSGFLCNDCMAKYGFSYLKNEDLIDLQLMDFSEIKESLEHGKEMEQALNNFKPTANIGGYALFDDQSKKLLISSRDWSPSPRSFSMFSYDQIIGFELIENGNTSMTDAAGGAIMGGMLFGGAGAVAGSNIMGSSKECTQLQVKLVVKNYSKPAFYTTYFDTNNRATIGSEQYNQKIKSAHDLLAKLSIVINERNKEEKALPNTRNNMQPKSVEINNININPNNVEPTIIRIELFLEDKEWEKAKAYAEAGLDYFPTDYRLYLYLLFADLHVSNYDELARCSTPFLNNHIYKKVVRFADDETVNKLSACAESACSSKESDGRTCIVKQDEVSEEETDIDTIHPDDPNYEYVEYKEYAMSVPKYFAHNNTLGSNGKGLHIFNVKDEAIFINVEETDTINGVGLSRATIISDDIIDSDNSTLHIVVAEMEPAELGIAQAFYRVKGDSVGLVVRSDYNINEKQKYVPDLKKCFLSIKKKR